MTIKFDLLENAADSIKHAIELLVEGGDRKEARRFKQAILATAHGIELLLKERLRKIHPVLIWESVDKFPSLSARTVAVDIALNRLINIGGLTELKDDVDLIRSIRDTRNAIEHYEWTTTKEEADLIIGQALSFALHFGKQELGQEFIGYESRKDDLLNVLLERNPELFNAFNLRFQKSASRTGLELQACNYCHTLSVNPSTQACKLCGHWNTYEGDIPF